MDEAERRTTTTESEVKKITPDGRLRPKGVFLCVRKSV